MVHINQLENAEQDANGIIFSEEEFATCIADRKRKTNRKTNTMIKWNTKRKIQKEDTEDVKRKIKTNTIKRKPKT